MTLESFDALSLYANMHRGYFPKLLPVHHKCAFIIYPTVNGQSHRPIPTT